MNAVSSTILIVLLLVVFCAPRRWALLAMMAGVFFLTQGHSLDVAGLNVYPVRFLNAAAFARVLVRRDLVWGHLNRLDWALLLLYNYVALVWLLRSSDAAAHQFASALDPTICYLALRGLIGSLDDLRWFLYAFVVLLVPYTALVFAERWTGQSTFLIVGASDELYFRGGVARCMGSFRHAILLGSVAASLVPLYIGLGLGRTRVLLAAAGAVLCLTLVFLSNSGGPVASVAAAFVGWLVWPFRRRMVLARGAILAGLACLLLFMKAPIWYLPFKISGLVGGAGYHRGLLLDRAWQDLDKWWLAGMEMKDTAPWIPYVHDLIGGADITNQFLVWGIRAGLLAIVLSAILLHLAFKAVGQEVGQRADSSHDPREFLVWGLGVAIFVHVVSWLGISYFDQSWVVWLMHLAAISAAVQTVKSRQAEQAVPVAVMPSDLQRPHRLRASSGTPDCAFSGSTTVSRTTPMRSAKPVDLSAPMKPWTK